MTQRVDGRDADQLRPLSIEVGFTDIPAASVLIKMGRTTVMCTASVEERVPRWMDSPDNESGWVTGTYSMLPGSTSPRFRREAARGKLKGRTHEIQRLIGRSMRAVTALDELGPRSVYLDCDVLQADGGTRTASITGAFVALVMACSDLEQQGIIDNLPFRDTVAAVSCGVVDGHPILDLAYTEDRDADVDMNFVMTGSGRFVELQGTGEEATFSGDELKALTELAQSGIDRLTDRQLEALPQTPAIATLFSRLP